MEQQEREEREAYMESLAPGFAIYAQLIDLEETNKSLLEQCSKRFAALTSALKSRGLQLQPTFKPCEQFIVAGDGNISDVVDTTEEMRFLDICTDYPRRCQWKVQSGHHGNKAICEEAKMELCIAYLENHRGLRLPRKWEDCRSRFEEVRRTGGIPQCEGRYIYSKMHLLSLRESTERISFAEAVYLLKVVGSRFCMDCVVLSSCNARK
ncbi:hypothetical protein JG687_00005792, partial [Phytophthora cactorum]